MKKIIIFMMVFLMAAPFGFAVKAELLNTDPYPLESGEMADIRFKITYSDVPPGEEREDEISRLNVTFVDTAIKLADDKRERSFLLKEDHAEDFYQMIEYRVIVGDVPEGEFPVMLEFGGDFEKKETIHVRVTDEQPEFSIGHVFSSPDDLYPDSNDNKLEVQVANIGDDIAESVILELHSDSFVPSSSLSTRYGIGSLEESQTGKGEFYVDIPEEIKPGEHTFNVSIISEEITEEKKVPFYVKGKPAFSLDTLHNEPVRQREDSFLKFELKNTGDEKAERVSVDVVKDHTVDIEFEQYTDFVGDLERGETGEAYLPFSVEDAAVKDNQVTLSVRYVFDDEVKTEDFPVKIRVLEREESFYEDPGILLGALILVIVGAILARMIFAPEK